MSAKTPRVAVTSFKFKPGSEARRDFGPHWNDASPADERLMIRQIQRKKRTIAALRASIDDDRKDLYTLRARRAPVARVPDDILSLIFEIHAEVLTPATVSKSFQTRCSQVCRAWHRVASQTRSLWLRFSIYDTGSLQFAKSLSAKHAPALIDIIIAFKCALTRTRGNLLKWTGKFIMDNGSRLRSIRSEMCHHGLAHLFSQLSCELPLLKTLNMTPDSRQFCNNSSGYPVLAWDGQGIKRAPVLYELLLSTAALSASFAVFPSIRRLELDNIRYGSSARLTDFLASFPNVEYVRLSAIGTGENVTPASERVTWNNLKTLELDWNAIIIVRDVLTAPFPSMKSLALGIPGTASDADVLYLLENTPSLAHLSLKFPPSDSYLQALTQATNTSASVLPQLRTFRLKARSHYKRHLMPSAISHDLLKFVSARATKMLPVPLLCVSPTLGAEHFYALKKQVASLKVKKF